MAEEAVNSDTPTGPSTKAAYQDLFERSIDAILLCDISSGQVLEANDAAQRTLQGTKEDIEKLNIYNFCQEAYLADFKKNVRIAARRYHPKLFEVPLVVGAPTPNIPIIAGMAISPLKLKDGSEVLQFLIRDITKQKDDERKIQEYIKQIELLATTDGLTGLINVRQFKKLLEAEHARALRYRTKYAVLFSDIDHFKKYNDQHGHPAGDALLKEYAGVIKSCLRATDVPARYGGEEFVVLLPESDTQAAAMIAERIRATIEKHPFPLREKQPMGFISASIGVACFPQDGSDFAQVLKAADDMVYKSKHGGRNRVTVSTGGEAPVIHHQD